MAKVMRTISSICMIVILFSCSSIFAKISQIEKQVLIDFYNSTNGKEWTRSWNLADQPTSWQGITIKNNKVVSIALMNNNLRGTLPVSIGNMKNLQVLNLAFNKIHGKLPEGIAQLKDLHVLRLGKNKLTGSIPEKIGDLKNLVILDLYSNKFSGKIPISLGRASQLKVVSISGNNISGRIPKELGNLKLLERLELADNNIYGDVPESIGVLFNLQVLALSENRLTGEFPSKVFSLPQLKVLQLQQNAFDQEQFRNSIPIQTDLALFDFDDIKSSFEGGGFENMYKNNNSRMAETTFEDDNDK